MVFEEFEAEVEHGLELVTADMERRAFMGIVIRIEKHNSTKDASRLEDLVDDAGVVFSGAGRDGGDTSMLPNEVIAFGFGPSEEVSEFPADVRGGVKLFRHCERLLRDIESGDRFSGFRENGRVSSETTAGMEDMWFFFEEVLMRDQKRREGRMRLSLFPRGLAVSVTSGPVHIKLLPTTEAGAFFVFFDAVDNAVSDRFAIPAFFGAAAFS